MQRREPDGSLVTHADLTGIGATFNEIVVDGRGNAYVNGDDGMTLFMLAAQWHGMDEIDDQARTGQVIVAKAPAARAGWPS